jgi:hypothetical protein
MSWSLAHQRIVMCRAGASARNAALAKDCRASGRELRLDTRARCRSPYHWPIMCTIKSRNRVHAARAVQPIASGDQVTALQLDVRDSAAAKAIEIVPVGGRRTPRQQIPRRPADSLARADAADRAAVLVQRAQLCSQGPKRCTTRCGCRQIAGRSRRSHVFAQLPTWPSSAVAVPRAGGLIIGSPVQAAAASRRWRGHRSRRRARDSCRGGDEDLGGQGDAGGQGLGIEQGGDPGHGRRPVKNINYMAENINPGHARLLRLRLRNCLASAGRGAWRRPCRSSSASAASTAPGAVPCTTRTARLLYECAGRAGALAHPGRAAPADRAIGRGSRRRC